MILADSLRNLVGVGWLPSLIIMALPLMSYLPMAATFAFAPGPDATLTIRSSLSGGRSHGLATGLGTASGSVVWGLSSAVGLAALVVSQPALFAILKVTGAVYLAFLGLQSLNSSVRTHRSAPQQSAAARRPLPLRPLLQRVGLRRSYPQRPALRETEPQHSALQQPIPQHSTQQHFTQQHSGTRTMTSLPSHLRAYRTGLLASVLNPKMGAFYLAVMPQFIPDEGNTFLWSMALMGIEFPVAVVTMSLYAVAADRLRVLSSEQRVLRWMDRILGFVLLGFAALLLVE
ncbi:LysE family translocator [Actinobaculum sp. 313]|uniref:LysE family translocator n=1 Tax=Actinobaculum sp. 313 TaxID=2495645 RepID=UPI000D5271ED|nr:LysE family translocator [Actinobaculum sp. 313]AWE42778.1 hypothetical protein DDD63_08510 [Actinobaculum sp. 313]